MGLNDAPMGERIHIGLYGKRNAGKSSLINAITNQNAAIVSDTLGTTSDPVLKSMELLPLGPCVIIDTPGLDDDGPLQNERIKKAYEMLRKTDIALLVVDATTGFSKEDSDIEKEIIIRSIPYIVVFNKCELVNITSSDEVSIQLQDCYGTYFGTDLSRKSIFVSANENINIDELKNMIGSLLPDKKEKSLISDCLNMGDVALLVVPIDKAAPKGRLILPQQQVIRDLLDGGMIPILCREHELTETLNKLKKKPDIVIVDSQVFKFVNDTISEDIPLTSFSVIMSRYKGNLESQAKAAAHIDKLKDGDIILISEGCTHHRQCGDIGTEKLPALLKKYTGKDISFEFTSGGEFSENLSKYSLIIHCGGCMLRESEMKYRLKCAEALGIKMTNYGTAIAYMNGILKRSLSVFGSK